MIDLTQTELIVLIVGAVLLVMLLIALLMKARSARERRERLAERFGPEYDRTLEAGSKRGDAERELQARLDRHEGITTHRVEPREVERFEQRLEDLQSRFVDAPAAAVVAAGGLLADIAVAVGYPDASTDQLLGDISVDHPAEIAEHRRGQALVHRSGEKSPSTEQLRAALVSSRHVCEALLAPSIAARSGRERHEDLRSGSDRRDDARVDSGRQDDVRSDSDRRDPLGADAERHEEVRSGSDRRDDTGGPSERRPTPGEQPGEGLLGPDGNPVR